jgi:hypothetical protein
LFSESLLQQQLSKQTASNVVIVVVVEFAEVAELVSITTTTTKNGSFLWGSVMMS